MHMNMKHRLAGSFIDVDSDIISVGVITLVHLLLHVLEHHIHCFTLMIGQIEIRGDMTLGNYQSMVLIPGDSRPPIPVILGHPC